MPLVHECAEEGCNVITMGLYCAEHERTTEALNDALVEAAASAAADARAPEDP